MDVSGGGGLQAQLAATTEANQSQVLRVRLLVEQHEVWVEGTVPEPAPGVSTLVAVPAPGPSRACMAATLRLTKATSTGTTRQIKTARAAVARACPA